MTDPIDPAALELERLWLGVTSADCEPGELARAFMAYAQALVEQEREARAAYFDWWDREYPTEFWPPASVAEAIRGGRTREEGEARGGGEGV